MVDFMPQLHVNVYFRRGIFSSKADGHRFQVFPFAHSSYSAPLFQNGPQAAEVKKEAIDGKER